MISRRPPNAPTGMPPPMILPSVVKSGRHPIERLRASQGDAKARITSSKTSSAPTPSHSRPQSLQKIRRRGHAIHVACHGLDNDAGDLLAELPEHALNLIAVVVVERHRMARQRPGHARRGGYPESQCAGARLDQQRIGMSVIAALELHDGVAPGEAASQPDRAHGRFGARAHERTNSMDGMSATTRRASSVSKRRRGAKAQAVGGDLLHGSDDLRMSVTQDHGSPGADVIDVAPIVRGNHVRALGFLDETSARRRRRERRERAS